MAVMKRVLFVLFAVMSVLLGACLVAFGIVKDKIDIKIAPYRRQVIYRIPHIEIDLPSVEDLDRLMSYETDNPLSPLRGAVYYDGHKETYYSQKVLPGESLAIPGRHVAFDGTIRDKDGYICVAADRAFLGYGEAVKTSLGWGKVYDSGCAYGTVDLYVDW